LWRDHARSRSASSRHTAKPRSPTRVQQKPSNESATTEIVPLEHVVGHAEGYGSPAAVEASCDARRVLARATTQTAPIIRGLANGSTLVEIAAEIGWSRFQVHRALRRLRHDLAIAASSGAKIRHIRDQFTAPIGVRSPELHAPA